MHSVQKELSKHLYPEVKSSKTTNSALLCSDVILLSSFLYSVADSLGSVQGVHIWHNNSGPSPEWYLKQVQVSEVVWFDAYLLELKLSLFPVT